MKSIQTLLLELPKTQMDSGEQIQIRGGGFIDDLMTNIFINSNQMPWSSDDITIFKGILTELNSTSIGHRVLQDIYNAGKEITLYQNTQPGLVTQFTGPGGVKYFLDGGDWTNFGTANYAHAQLFKLVSHELYHAYQRIVDIPGFIADNSGYFGTVRKELDADIFSIMTAVESDRFNGTQYSWDLFNSDYYPSEFSFASTQTSTAYLNFNSAWNDVFANHNFSTQNYNTLIENFLSGSTYTQGVVGAGSSLSTTTVSGLDLAFDYDGIYSLFTTWVYNNWGVYGTDPLQGTNPIQGSGGNSPISSNGGGGTSSSGFSFIDFMSQISSAQNSGTIFYVSTTYTPGGTFNDPINPNQVWITTPGQLNYVQATLGNFYDAYNWISGIGAYSGGGGGFWLGDFFFQMGGY